MKNQQQKINEETKKAGDKGKDDHKKDEHKKDDDKKVKKLD